MNALHTDSAVQFYGVILLLIGLSIRYFTNRKRAYRFNRHGVEEFNSYEQKTLLRSLESLLRFIALPLILFGLFLVLVGRYNKKTVEKLRAKKTKSQNVKIK